MRQADPIKATSYAGAVASIVSSMTLTEVGSIAGLVAPLLKFGLNAWYTRRKDRREMKGHAARMRAMGGCDECRLRPHC